MSTHRQGCAVRGGPRARRARGSDEGGADRSQDGRLEVETAKRGPSTLQILARKYLARSVDGRPLKSLTLSAAAPPGRTSRAKAAETDLRTEMDSETSSSRRPPALDDRQESVESPRAETRQSVCPTTSSAPPSSGTESLAYARGPALLTLSALLSDAATRRRAESRGDHQPPEVRAARASGAVADGASRRSKTPNASPRSPAECRPRGLPALIAIRDHLALTFHPVRSRTGNTRVRRMGSPRA